MFENTRVRFFDVQSFEGMTRIANKYPKARSIVYAEKTHRLHTAPKHDDLFGLLVARAKPMALDGGWYNCGEGAARKLIANVLENPDAKIGLFDSHDYCDRRQKEGNKKQEKEEEKHRRTYGQARCNYDYVYAFAHKKSGWVKIGMTAKEEEQRCWDRINNYIKQHGLPVDGWQFVGFIACTKAQELEARVT